MERWNIYAGDCLKELKKIEPESVQTVVTSPPYWGLRDYDVDGQVGMEKTPDEYVKNIVNIFRQVGRVLRDDGTVWLNLGDSYNGSGGDHKKGGKNDAGFQSNVMHGVQPKRLNNLKPKDLVGIPWRVAFALQADGWYLRSDIIWHKPNPMPESVQDRPTKSHEYIFLLTKSPHYYYDADAIREPHTWEESKPRTSGMERNAQKYRDKVYGGGGSGFAGHNGTRKADGSSLNHPLGKNKRDVWTINTKSFPEAHFATFPEKLIDTCIKAGSKENDIVLDPFSGAGTTGVVACKLNRTYIGIELNPEYAEMSKNRLARTVGATEEQSYDMESNAVQGSLL